MSKYIIFCDKKNNYASEPCCVTDKEYNSYYKKYLNKIMGMKLKIISKDLFLKMTKKDRKFRKLDYIDLEKI